MPLPKPGRLRNPKPQFIVGEVSKNWPEEDGSPLKGHLIQELFENLIEENWKRGYKLHSFQLNRLESVIGTDRFMNETIIAVFELIDSLPRLPPRLG